MPKTSNFLTCYSCSYHSAMVEYKAIILTAVSERHPMTIFFFWHLEPSSLRETNFQ